jgi:hypothetical protein
MDPCTALLDAYFILLFNYHTLSSGTIIILSETPYCMKWTKYYKLILIIGSWM